jgi:putative lipoic acid-binding regulatory protein
MAGPESETLLEFPCDFPIKMMGRDDDGFQTAAVALVERHAGKVAASAINVARSRNGNFVSITITIEAKSQQQLDNIYNDLSKHEDILVAL